METALVSSQKSTLYLTNPSPRTPILTSFIHPTNIQNLKSPSRTWKLHANAKGFASSTPPATMKESTNIDKTSNRNNNNGDDEEIPQEVFERMIVRILVSVGGPMAVGLAFLHLFDLVREQHLWDFPIWIPFMTTFLTFGASALGIAYGALSTSLDPKKKGSLLGFEEAQQNWAEMWQEEDERK